MARKHHWRRRLSLPWPRIAAIQAKYTITRQQWCLPKRLFNFLPPPSSCGTFFAVPFARVGDTSSGEIALEKNDQQNSLRAATAVAESPPRGDASDTNEQPPPAAGYKSSGAVAESPPAGDASDTNDQSPPAAGFKSTVVSGEHRTGNNATVSGEEQRPRCYSSPAADPSEGRWRKCDGGVQDSPAFTGDLTGTWSHGQFLGCGRSAGTGPCLLLS